MDANYAAKWVSFRCKSTGMGEVIIAPADLRRRHAEYIGFVIQVLDDLKAESDTAQPPLELTQISHIYLGARPAPFQSCLLYTSDAADE